VESVRAGVSKSQRIWSHWSPKVKSAKPSIEHLAWNLGGDFLIPKLLLISKILAKFSRCMIILSLEINLDKLESILRNYKHGTNFG